MSDNNANIRYAVVGLGHIAQVAVLPAFAHTSENSELTAFISDDPEKLYELSKKYKVSNCFSYEQYEDALRGGTFDAVYIALPNDMHKEFAIKAARAGIHVLCEKPMALTEYECQEMIEECQANKVKLMVAYRLHFERANMEIVELINSGKIGNPRIFNSSFTLQVREGNIRTQKERGGGPLYDIGVYCINAARYIFRDEPIQAMALSAKSNDSRFAEIEEAVSVVLKFPGERLASFDCSFGSKDVSRYEVIGSSGRIAVDPAYEYIEELKYVITVDGREEKHKVNKHDQFAPEILHFSDCILQDKEPRPSGKEGLADIRIIQAIQNSLLRGETIALSPTPPKTTRPDSDLIKEKPAVKKPETVNARSGSL
jgi:predicted dehydrogenase